MSVRKTPSIAVVEGHLPVAMQCRPPARCDLKHEGEPVLLKDGLDSRDEPGEEGVGLDHGRGALQGEPTAYALRPDRLRPRSDGTQPSRRATSTMRPRVSSDTPGRPFNAADTDEIDTPASAATSRMVTRRLTTGSSWTSTRAQRSQRRASATAVRRSSSGLTLSSGAWIRQAGSSTPMSRISASGCATRTAPRTTGSPRPGRSAPSAGRTPAPSRTASAAYAGPVGPCRERAPQGPWARPVIRAFHGARRR